MRSEEPGHMFHSFFGEHFIFLFEGTGLKKQLEKTLWKTGRADVGQDELLKRDAYLNRMNCAVFSQRCSVLHLLLQNMTPGCTAICKVIARKRSTIKLIIVSLCFCFPCLDNRPKGLMKGVCCWL